MPRAFVKKKKKKKKNPAASLAAGVAVIRHSLSAQIGPGPRLLHFSADAFTWDSGAEPTLET